MSAVAQPAQPIVFYGFPKSGHAHRVGLFLSLLDLPHEEIVIDLANKQQKQPEFLELNGFGQVPVIDDAGTIVADSNAILVYLAIRYADESWLPRDPASAAQVQRWLSVAAGQIAAGPAAARMVTVFGAPFDHDRTKAIADALFAIMERHLTDRLFLVGNGPTIADIAGYSYIAHAPEGGVSLAPYPHIRAWLARIEALPRFVAMPATKAGLAA
ncbi:MAG TPA: glutathione S-transferase [Aliidongia sp.]|uniref:glutathione S-transferase family protein n=1 Tax=Aliidongia sp. TaxID=1914230 RepID=UPI002DDCD420|nr:glutathione S-transferase [Aliidongia sp.]HEV2673423.1 glutathione S-transferase [Aliidongia sp.]